MRVPKHSFKFLFLFLRTVVLDPELASLVHTRDIREWEKKRSTLLTEKKTPPRGQEEMKHQEAYEEETYDQYIQLLHKSAEELPIEEFSVDCLQSSINHRDIDGLLAY